MSRACNSRSTQADASLHETGDCMLCMHILQVVNGPSHPGAVGNPPSSITPPSPRVQGMGSQEPSGWRDLLQREGPDKWAQAIRQHKGALVTDTTM